MTLLSFTLWHKVFDNSRHEISERAIRHVRKNVMLEFFMLSLKTICRSDHGLQHACEKCRHPPLQISDNAESNLEMNYTTPVMCLCSGELCTVKSATAIIVLLACDLRKILRNFLNFCTSTLCHKFATHLLCCYSTL